MSRAWIAAAALVGASLWACGDDTTRALPRFERSCDLGSECPGRKCVQVEENEQGLPGVCSRACSSDLDCGSGAACFLLGEAGPSCLALCSATQPCEGGLACAVVGSAGERACFVEPVTTGALLP